MTAKSPRTSLGVRETNRLQRLERIKQEARQLFNKNGYDRTTLRMIAKKANVGAATIFRYAKDKRDLLYLLFDSDHSQVNQIAITTANNHKNFLDQCIGSFRHFYEYFGRNPEFARSVLREALIYPPEQANRAYSTKARSIERIKQLVSQARIRGEIRTKATDDAIAKLIFELYQIECRRWLTHSKPAVNEGLRSLRHALEIIYHGLEH